MHVTVLVLAPGEYLHGRARMARANHASLSLAQVITVQSSTTAQYKASSPLQPFVPCHPHRDAPAMTTTEPRHPPATNKPLGGPTIAIAVRTTRYSHSVLAKRMPLSSLPTSYLAKRINLPGSTPLPLTNSLDSYSQLRKKYQVQPCPAHDMLFVQASKIRQPAAE